MTLNDRFTRGMIAGIVAGFALNFVTLTSYYILQYSHLRWLDWAAIMVYGRRPEGFMETVIAYLLQLSFSALVGVVFAYLTTFVKSKNYYLKGIFYSLSALFLLFAIINLFKIPGLINQPLSNIITDLVGVLIWGIVLSLTMTYLDKKTKHSA